MADERVRTWRPGWECRPSRQLGGHRRGTGDPTFVTDGRGGVVRAAQSPHGPVTIQLHPRPDEGTVEGRAWGPGATWALDRMPQMLGDDDDPHAFVPRHDVLVEAARRLGVVRLAASGMVLDALVPTVLEQKVTGQEANTGFRRLVRRFGRPASGPWADRGLLVGPDAATVASIASWDWLAMPVSPDRARALTGAARRAEALERLTGHGVEALDRGLRSLPGIGRWTSAEVRARVLGDPDAVSVGDYHVAADIGWALTGRQVDDAEMLELLEPYRGHRLRVQLLVQLGRLGRPRRGPRMAPRTHLPGEIR